MLQEFKEFIDKGNVVDAAVGLIMALAFLPIVNSLVEDIILPIVARVFSQPDFSELKIGLGGTEEVTLEDGTIVMREAAIRYGEFINEVFTFVIIAFVVFMLVRAYNRAMNVKEEEGGPTEVELLQEIRDGLKA